MGDERGGEQARVHCGNSGLTIEPPPPKDVLERLTPIAGAPPPPPLGPPGTKWDTTNATPQTQSEGDNALNPVEAARLLPHPGTRDGTNCKALSA